ncbi:MAG: hypothetical protein K8R59_14485 [Thermoanaerobaculales bacterium]|nr:hypothetical protein [Thermoanaerobaculales bacterium]
MPIEPYFNPGLLGNPLDGLHVALQAGVMVEVAGPRQYEASPSIGTWSRSFAADRFV